MGFVLKVMLGVKLQAASTSCAVVSPTAQAPQEVIELRWVRDRLARRGPSFGRGTVGSLAGAAGRFPPPGSTTALPHHTEIARDERQLATASKQPATGS